MQSYSRWNALHQIVNGAFRFLMHSSELKATQPWWRHRPTSWCVKYTFPFSFPLCLFFPQLFSSALGILFLFSFFLYSFHLRAKSMYQGTERLYQMIRFALLWPMSWHPHNNKKNCCYRGFEYFCFNAIFYIVRSRVFVCSLEYKHCNMKLNTSRKTCNIAITLLITV